MALHVQNQIRNNAEEVNGFFQDMAKWEKDIQAKDRRIIRKKQTRQTRSVQGTRQGAGTVAVSSSVPSKSDSAAKHTYDVGYKKWEKIRISEADDLEEMDGGEKPPVPDPPIPESTSLTPASLASLTGAQPASLSPEHVPRARGEASGVDIETYERERGNSEFKAGNFANAVKCYTKCLGLKPKNYIAFSNRAMAFLKQKEYHKAETDCSCALRITPEHVKSLLRRATARAQLGKYRAAISDLQRASALDPSNKQVHQELKRARDSLKSAASKAPCEPVRTMWEADYQHSLQVEAEEEEAARRQCGEEGGESCTVEAGVEENPQRGQSFTLAAGPELPPPVQLQRGLPRGAIDMTQLAEEVEQELAESSPQSEELAGSDEEKRDAVGLNVEDNDGEWVVVTSPEKRSTRLQIVEEDDDAEVEVVGGDQGAGSGAGTTSRDSSTGPPVAQTSAPRQQGGGHASAKVRSKQGSGRTKKASDKKKSSKKAASPSRTEMYSVERSLLSLKGNDTLLTEFLESIDEQSFLSPPSSKNKGGAAAQVLEVDVVVDLLLAVARCFGERGQQWARVLQWFEGVAARSGSASFSFVASMLSSQQRTDLKAVLATVERSCSLGGDAAASFSHRIQDVRSVYGLN